jgi:hypothetical protein
MRRLWLLPALLLMLLPASAGAAPYLPPGKTVFHGGTGGYDRAHIRQFGQLSGQAPSVYQYFFTPSWTRADQRSLNWERGLLGTSAAAGTRTMFALSTARGGHGGSVITPAAMARGAGDPYLLSLNRLIADTGQVVYVRLMAEMNNFNNPYSAFNGNGSRRGRAYSTRAFRSAWRRAALVLRGGDVAAIDARLRRLRLPRVRTAEAELPAPKVSLLWVPFCAGLPYVAGNGPGAYWPGGRYVDWVGTDFFANSPNFPCLGRLYKDRRWKRKPFAFGEWALWGRDDPGFVRKLFGWVRSHKRVRMAVYNQGATLKPFLRLRPRSAGELRRQLRSRHFYAPVRSR